MNQSHVAMSPAQAIEFSVPEPTGLRRNDVEALAENIAAQMGYLPGADIFSAVVEAGGRVDYKDYWDSKNIDSGSLVVYGEGNFEIFLSTETSHLRDKFTVAHELGHYVLHYLYPRQVLSKPINYLKADRYGTNKTEWEANWFAAAFLMPKRKFTNDFRSAQGRIREVSELFGVSESAVKIRARSLGLTHKDDEKEE